ncbi:DUF481 domain-containing protein [Ekhidna sp.]|uniref:DUF481 domain-containing protein n=1 Tax=Ekhidna sp. TaxID=2608089 RepID=UPI003BABA934
MKQALLSSILLLLIFSTQAQILKVDKGFLATDSSNYFTGVIDATFAINNRSSTVDEQNIYVGVNNNVDLVYIAEKSATILISGLNYYKIGDGPLIYNGTAHVREVLRRSAELTPEFFGQIQFDESRNMELRWLLGGGYRWNIIQKKNSLYTGIGIFREYERWSGPVETIEKRLWKLNSYVSADVKLTTTTNINAIVYFQSGKDSEINAFRNRLSGQLEFKNALTDQFKVKMTSNFLLDDKPIIPLNKFIYEVYFGVEYSFN